MRVTTERLEQCQVNVVIELDAAEVEEKLRQTARNISRKYNVPGYRRGHAPYAAVIRAFGREAVQQTALDDIGQELYDQALKEVPYEPFQAGELKEVQWEPFRMTVLLPIKPEVDLGDYREVRIPLEVPAVSDEQVEESLAQIRREHAQWVPVERPAALGDQVVIDSRGLVDEQELWSEEGHETILEAGATAPVPGFNEAIVGLSAGEEKVFTLSFPEDDPQQGLAGKEVTCTVRLHTVKEQDLPPLDDDLATMVGDYDTLADLRAALRQGLETQARQRAEAEYPDRVLEAMLDRAVKIEYPPQAVDREAELALKRMEQNLSTAGIQLDAYLKALHKTRDGYKAGLRPSAEQRLRKRLALIQIAKNEGLEIKSDEIKAEVNRLVEMLGDEDDDLRQFLTTPEGYLAVADDLILARVQERVVQIARGEAPPLAAPAEGDAPAEGATPEAAAPAEAAPEGPLPTE